MIELTANEYLIRDHWPSTAYLKSLDLWTTLCYINAFTPLIEYCVVLFLIGTMEQQRDGGNSQVIKPNSRAKQYNKKVLYIYFNL